MAEFESMLDYNCDFARTGRHTPNCAYVHRVKEGEKALTLTLMERDKGLINAGDRVRVDQHDFEVITVSGSRTLIIRSWPSRWQRVKRRVLLTFRSLSRGA